MLLNTQLATTISMNLSINVSKLYMHTYVYAENVYKSFAMCYFHIS